MKDPVKHGPVASLWSFLGLQKKKVYGHVRACSMTEHVVVISCPELVRGDTEWSVFGRGGALMEPIRRCGLVFPLVFL